jgi:hypothetical protein
MADRTLYMDRGHVARFDMPRIGPLVTDRYMVIRPDRCPGTPTPAEPGWWKWKAADWSPSKGQAIGELPKLIKPHLPKVRDPGVLAVPSPWLVRYEDWTRMVLVVGSRPAPVDVDAWDRWEAYLDATFGERMWQARQTGRNRPVTFWRGNAWLGLLLPVHDQLLPNPPPALIADEPDYRAVPDPPSRES